LAERKTASDERQKSLLVTKKVKQFGAQRLQNSCFNETLDERTDGKIIRSTAGAGMADRVREWPQFTIIICTT
jgi:CRISPR/Cas system-associated endoribonuclease Cas2